MNASHLKRLIKLGISLVYFVTSALLRRTLNMIARPTGQTLTILYYHGVARGERSRFARQMETLKRTACVVPASYRGVLPPGKRHVAITFDDAFESVRENAMPELLARSFHSTIFVPTGFLGRRPSWVMREEERARSEMVMTADQLSEFPSDLVTLGSHGSMHVHLSQTQPDRAKEEIEGSRRELEHLIGREVRLFSFPYGDHDASSVELCAIAGYEQAFTIRPEQIKTDETGMLRGRVKVDPSDWPIEFFLKINGAYAWMTTDARRWTIFNPAQHAEEATGAP
jgi:peptidoglycan/xylan/chitin deacetylase (PgdA/CDA1 family)